MYKSFKSRTNFHLTLCFKCKSPERSQNVKYNKLYDISVDVSRI